MTVFLWVIALAFSVEQNCYFGWNSAPHSDAELITDGIAAILFALAMIGCRSRP